MKERYCFECRKKLNFHEYMIQNYHLNENNLKNFWQHNLIEFYCCSCFKQRVLLEKENIFSLSKLNKKKSLIRGI